MPKAEYVDTYIWFVMTASPVTRDGSMPVAWFYCHDQAADFAMRHYPGVWLEPGFERVHRTLQKGYVKS